MKINNLNAGNMTAGTQSMDAQVKRTGQGGATHRPVEQPRTVESDNISADRTGGKEATTEAFDEDMLQKSVDQANKALETYNRKIERAVHEVTHVVMYTVKDTVTNEVIQEFPPKKIQDMIAKMWELAGLFVDEKA